MSPSGWEQNAIYLQSGDPELEDTPNLMEPGLLGSRFTIQNPVGRGAPPPIGSPTSQSRSKRYQLVKTDSTMAVKPYPGAVAYWQDKASYTTTTVNTNLNSIAGVYRVAQVNNGGYLCVQITGPCMTKVVDGSVGACVVGDQIIGSAATAGKADRVASGTALTQAALGRIANPNFIKSPAEALVQIDLDVPETP